MPSFSLNLINIFVGLFSVSQDRSLKRYSNQIKDLGYEAVEIEPTFTSGAGRVNPEAIAYSPKSNQSLQVEWTELSEPPITKEQQIRRYLRVEPHHIEDKIGQRPQAVSTWLIAADHCEPSYNSMLESFPPEVDQKIMLCSFISRQSSHLLRQTRGSLEDLDLSKMISEGILIERIAYDYVKVDLHNLQAPEILGQIVRQLVNFHSIQKLEFDSEEITSEAFGSAWSILSEEKRKSFKARSLSILNEFSDFAGKKHIERVMNEPPTWLLKGGTTAFLKVAKKYIQEKNK